MTFTVIGHLCFDVIELLDGNEIQSYGGIYFPLAALANFLSPDDKILPVFGIGKTDYNSFIDHLKMYPNIDTSGIFKFSGPTNQVRLKYSTGGNRIECSKHISESIPWKRIHQYLDTDMILVDMISGFDISLETLDEIRMEIRDKKIPIYLDVHCLPCRINEDFTRSYCPVQTWRRWLFMLHAVQMNIAEATHLTPERLDESSLAKHVLALNTKALHITKGDSGSTLYMDGHKQINRLDLQAFDTEKSIDPTGCGDVFAAAYCAHYIKSKDMITSARFADRVASFNAQLLGSKEINKLTKFRLSEFHEIAS